VSRSVQVFTAIFALSSNLLPFALCRGMQR
jgi:hypothetical protein